MATGDTHDFQFQTTFLHQLLALLRQLLNQASTHRAHATKEKVEHLVFRKEKTIMNHIQRLAQVKPIDHKRDIRFRSSLRTGNHVDAAPPQGAKQFSGNTGCMLHVLAHDGHRGQTALRLHAEHRARFNLFGKLRVQHLTGRVGIRVAHTDGRAVLGRSLRHEEHADAIVRQRGEDAPVHADDPDHGQPRDGNQRRPADARNALDGLLVALNFLLDNGAFPARVEGILDKDGDILDAHRVNRGRIDHFRPEVAKFHGFHVAQFVDGVGRGNHFRVGSHEAVHVRPDFQHRGVQGRRDDGRRVIRPSTSQVGHLAGIRIGRNKTRNQRHLGHFRKSHADQFVRQFRGQQLTARLDFRLDKRPRVKPFGPADQSGHDAR